MKIHTLAFRKPHAILRRVLCLALLALVASGVGHQRAAAQESSTQESSAQGSAARTLEDFQAREIVVGTHAAPPFVIKSDDGEWSGLAIDLWRNIADRHQLRYRIVERPNVPALLDGLRAGDLDILVSPLTVTAARERDFDFTSSFYSTGLGIAVIAGGALSWRPVISALMSFSFLQAILALVGLALVFGLVVWLFERRHNEQFGGTAVRGLSSSVWWTTVAMTQRGAGMSGPRTMPGRAVAMVWMVGSIIAIAVFTASITSALTVRHLEGSVHSVTDLVDVRVGVVAGTSAQDALTQMRIKHIPFVSIHDGLAALQKGKIDAFVHDKAILAWAVSRDFPGAIHLLDAMFDPQNYAFMLPPDSPLRKPISITLLETLQGGWWEDVQIRYLGYR